MGCFCFVGVWPWFGLFGQENVVVKHPTCMVMDGSGTYQQKP